MDETILERLVWAQYEDLWWPAILYSSYLELQQDVYSQLDSYVIKAQFAHSIMRQMQEKRQVHVARLLGRPTLEIVEIVDTKEDCKEFYFHVADILPQVCDMSNYRGRLDLFVDVHRALDEVDRMFIDVTNCGMGLPMGEYTSWFERAKAKLDHLPVLLMKRESQNEIDFDDDALSVNSLHDFRRSMGNFPQMERISGPQQRIDDVKALARELMETTKSGKLPSYNKAPGTRNRSMPSDRSIPATRSLARTSDISCASNRTVVAEPTDPHETIFRESLSDNHRMERNGASARGRSGLRLPSLVHNTAVPTVSSGSSSEAGLSTQEVCSLPELRSITPSKSQKRRSERSRTCLRPPSITRKTDAISKSYSEAGSSTQEVRSLPEFSTATNIQTDHSETSNHYGVQSAFTGVSTASTVVANNLLSSTKRGKPPLKTKQSTATVHQAVEKNISELEKLEKQSEETKILPPISPRASMIPGASGVEQDGAGFSCARLQRSLRRPSPHHFLHSTSSQGSHQSRNPSPVPRFEESSLLKPPHRQQTISLQEGSPVLSSSASWSCSRSTRSASGTTSRTTASTVTPPSGLSRGRSSCRSFYCSPNNYAE